MINPKAIRELWERVKTETMLGFPNAPRALQFRRALALFGRRLWLLVGVRIWA